MCCKKKLAEKGYVISEKETTTVKTDTSKTHTNVVDYNTQSTSKEPNQINTTKKGRSVFFPLDFNNPEINCMGLVHSSILKQE